MRELALCGRTLSLAVTVALVATAAAEAGPLGYSDIVVCCGSDLSPTATTDVSDAMAAYLGSNTFAVVTDMDIAALAKAAIVTPAPLPKYLPVDTTVVAYNAPAAPGGVPAAPPAPVQLASLEFPHVSGLADLGSSGRDVPLRDTTFFSMGPGGFGGYMSGRPVGGIENWSHITRTAISYIRPSVNLQMMLALEVPGTAPLNDFEGPGLAPHA